jgi:HEAT repeat protein
LLPVEASEIRRQASLDLALLGPAASNAVPALSLALKDSASDVRLAVLQALRQIGSVAHSATPQLLELLEDSTYTYSGRWGGVDLRAEVARALGQIAPGDKAVISGLVAALGDPNEEVRVTAAAVLASSVRQGAEAAPTLLEALGRADKRSKALLIRALGEIRPPNPRAAGVLATLLESGDYFTQATVVEALGNMRLNSPALVGKLKELFLSTSAERMPSKVHGYSAAQTVEMIYIDPVHGAHWGLHRRVICALGRLGTEAADLVPLLAREYSMPDNVLRFDAAVARWRIDGEATEMMDVLRQGLRAPDATTRELAVARLGEVAGQCAEAFPLLMMALNDPTGRIRVQAIELLSAQGTNAVPAITALQGLQADANYSVRRAVTNALSTIQVSSLAATSGTL